MDEGLILADASVRLRDGDRQFSLLVKSLMLAPGRAVALTGASGSGKTLLLELLGLLRPLGPGTRFAWRNEARETDLAALWRGGARGGDLARMRGRLFGFVPQSGGLLPFLSVAENVALTQRATGREDPDWAGRLIDRLGLAEVAGLRPGALSIGQRQRTAIARAMAHRPPFVIADEPTAALDPESADAVLGLFLETAAAEGCGVILSSHDRDRIARFGIDRLHLETRATEGGTESRLEAGVSC